MTIYDEYYVRYREAINLDLAKKGGKADMELRPEIWITFQFLKDRNVEPWEIDKLTALFAELEEQKEDKMLEMLTKGLGVLVGMLDMMTKENDE